MIVGDLSAEQMERLRVANELHKYGHLQTWQELFVYQQICKDKKQIMEIADYAKHKNNGVDVILPLKNYMKISSDDKQEGS